MRFSFTDCCALTQLSGVGNDTPKEAIEAMMALHGGEVGMEWNPRAGWGGAPTLFAIVVLPHERKLRDNLLSLGWECRFIFPRRNGYPEGKNAFFTYSYPMRKEN